MNAIILATALAGCNLMLNGFKSDSAFVVPSEIVLAPEVIAKTMDFYHRNHIQQLMFVASGTETLVLDPPYASSSIEKSKNYDLPKEMASELPPELVQALRDRLNQTAKAWIQARSGEFDYMVDRAYIVLRMSSNTFGQRIEGLHVHSSMPLGHPSRIEFSWALKGLGTVAQSGDQLIHAQENEILFFGDRTPHGSPDSDEIRLFALGGVVIRKKN